MNTSIVTLLGGDNGYGESVVVKVHDHFWIVIDSSIEPTTGNPLALIYLNRKNVDISNDVRMVICTHWHSDHIKGLDKILERCKSAKFVCAMATDKDKFLRYIEFEARPEKNGFSSTDIFYNCINIAYKRKTDVIIASQDKLLSKDEVNGIKSFIYSLSPSDDTMKSFLQEITAAFKTSTANTKIIEQSPNERCVVLLISVNKYNVILGGDLESKGWTVILENSEALKDRKFNVIKIPHHGSDTAYLKELWSNFADHVIAHVSAYNRLKEPLPKEEMLRKYSSLSDELYLTSDYTQKKAPKKRERSLQKAIQRLNSTIYEIPYRFGEIESEINLGDPQAKWITHTKGCALKIDEKYWESKSSINKKVPTFK